MIDIRETIESVVGVVGYLGITIGGLVQEDSCIDIGRDRLSTVGDDEWTTQIVIGDRLDLAIWEDYSREITS